MRGWAGLLVVAAVVVFGSGANAVAAVRHDQLPAKVRAGDRHVVVKSGVVGDSGDRCGLFIAGVRAGSCDAGFPLRGMLEVELEHPTGQLAREDRREEGAAEAREEGRTGPQYA